MQIVSQLVVVPNLPPQLGPLRDLAYNVWWSWDYEGVDLFRRIDREMWEECYHNPVSLLSRVSQERLEELAHDDTYLSYVARVCDKFNAYMRSPSLPGLATDGLRMAYFSAEFGLTESLPIYSGGLGMLAGDHLKSASDLGLPLVGVGLLYREGYFRQYLNVDGWQQEYYPENDFYNMPMEPLRTESGEPMRIRVNYPNRPVVARLWRVSVGRVPLYLLDTNDPENEPADREITARLYGGDSNMRIRQEILLGIGGLQALEALGIQPSVCHMNEGHSAFLALERVRRLMERHHCTFEQAREAVSAGNVFTTHTPVPAGNDAFSPALMERYFGSYYGQLGLRRDQFLGLGRRNPSDPQESFCMTVLALRLSGHRNGVSALHGEVSRKMWKDIWAGVPEAEIPINSITNGVHTCSWISYDLAGLYDRYLGPQWVKNADSPRVWERVDGIPNAELWRTHERRRERLVSVARRRLREQYERRGHSQAEVALADEVLDPEALTIGFARRFATYKRATLLFRDLDRLVRLLTDRQRPVQIIFAGKAHPNDTPGKELIRDIVHQARRPELRRHVVFLEDYDMNVARYMVEGVDLWLNTPLRPMEASGTSGMKATMNGALHMSVLDGWWCEGYRKDNGWAIGNGETYQNIDEQNEVEGNAIYDLLEKDVVPLFYDRGADGLPRAWIKRMKTAIKTMCPVFCTSRMVTEYTRNCYQPAHHRWMLLTAQGMAQACQLADWRTNLERSWMQVSVTRVQVDGTSSEVPVGHNVPVRTWVKLDRLRPDDVRVEACYGPLNATGQLERMNVLRLEPTGNHDDGTCEFAGLLSFQASGRQGVAVRVLPQDERLISPFDTGLITWATRG